MWTRGLFHLLLAGLLGLNHLVGLQNCSTHVIQPNHSSHLVSGPLLDHDQFGLLSARSLVYSNSVVAFEAAPDD